MQNEVVLKVEGLSKSFLGVKALNNVSLEVRRGEVHAVIGENGAGKSTMMNIILGDLPRDEGTIIVKGKETHFTSPADAIKAGISMIHQEISLVPTLTVAENIWLYREDRFMNGILINNRKRIQATKELLDRLNISIKPEEIVSNLTVAQCQLVELARSVSCDSDVIIMDEPTSSLSEKEVDILFKIIRNLRDQGVSIIFITHKLEELMTISDRVSVYRDGKYIGTKNCSETTRDELVSMIIGRELKDQYPPYERHEGNVVMEVKNLSGEGFSDVSFKVHAGEVLGFYGLVGAGRSEIMRAIFGVDKFKSGEILINGIKVNIDSPQKAVEHGIAMINEDRRDYGIVKTASVIENMTLATINDFTNKMGLINRTKERNKADQMIKEMHVKVSDPKMLITSLSGGNQQKVIIGRWLMANPKLLIMDEPTRGIDIGAKSEIYRLIDDLKKQGIAIILVSSEMPEIIGLSDRVYVVREGKLVFECTHDEVTQELLGTHALG
jgi:inositol transport system ATP-binding protein